MRSVPDRLRSLREDRVALAVLAVVALGLVARLAFLGARVAHWDEARVAYWALEFGRTGEFEYRPIVHGPFLQQINRFVFALLGPTDFAMRLVVALLGGSLPLIALLVRHRLRPAETVALAVFLAADPILLYYSRFMRSDIPVAVFMMFSFAFFVRAIDARRSKRSGRSSGSNGSGGSGYFHAGVIALALGLTAKENALLYVVGWMGGVGLLAVQWLLFLGRPSPGWRERTRVRVRRLPRRLSAWLPNGVLAVAEFLVVIVLFYAPRTAGPGDSGLDDALADPGILPGVVTEATVGSWMEFTGQWVETQSDYAAYLGDFAQTLGYGASALVVLAVLGFLVNRYVALGSLVDRHAALGSLVDRYAVLDTFLDRYGGERPNDLVAVGFYIGVANVLGYPFVTDIQAPWLAVHAVVWLAFPAAAGAALLYRRGRSAYAAEGWDATVTTAAVAIALLAVTGQIAFVGANAVYLDPKAPEGENALVQYAQPGGDLKPAIRRMERITARHDGTDVLVFGGSLADEQAASDWRPACTKWFNALPLPWYFERSADDIDVTCATNASQLGRFDGEYPPVVIARASDGDAISARLDGYTSEEHLLRTNAHPTTFFFDRDALAANGTAASRRVPAIGPTPIDRGVPPDESVPMLARSAHERGLGGTGR